MLMYAKVVQHKTSHFSDFHLFYCKLDLWNQKMTINFSDCGGKKETDGGLSIRFR